MFYVGIDWADQKHDFVVLDEAGQYVVKPKTIEKSYDGFEQLRATLTKVSTDPGKVKVAIETSHNLIVDFLVELGYSVSVLFPGLMPGFRKRYRVSGARDDIFDAYVLADSLRTDKNCWHEVKPGSDLTRQIRVLARDHHDMLDKRVVLINSLRATLCLYYPEYIHFFQAFYCKTSLAFLAQYPDFEAARKLSVEEILQFFKEHGYNNSKAAGRIHACLQQPHIHVPQPLIEAKKYKALSLCRMIQYMNASVAAYESRLKELVCQHPDGHIFLSYPAVAFINAARLISLFGDDRSRFQCVEQPRSLCGTCPVTDRTGGNDKRGAIYFRRACNKYYRDVIQQVAFSSLSQCKWAKHYYDRHRNSGHFHNHAVRALANQHLKILFAMWKNKTQYDENIFLAQKQRNMTRELIA
jgi:transposase